MAPIPFRDGGIWLRGDGPGELAAPLSPAALAAVHPLWASDCARLAPWREVVFGPEAGPAAGQWFVAQGPAGQVSPPVLVVGECASSLDVGWTLAAAGLLPPFASVVAVTQSQGRGQMRRSWSSPPGNLYAALAWPVAPGDLGAMAPVLVGYCLAEGLAGQGFPVLLKWPNDLLLDGGKVAGILIEERCGQALAGIGLNCVAAPDPTELRRGHAVPAGTLAAFGPLPGLVALWAGLVQSGQTCYRQCVTVSGSGERSRLVARRVAWLGREVLVRENESNVFRARIVGLAEDGGLRLRHGDGGRGMELTLHSGSISLL
jgi:BirA family transcriptional regulator, biotin operon repressor / biotin---[acetyl-CoA-carboxylase] ligase